LSVVACPAQQPQSAEAVRRVRDILVRAGVKFKTDNGQNATWNLEALGGDRTYLEI
jgi:hypothetical protein